MMNTVQKGDIAELAIATDLVKRGNQVAFPFSTSCDWDLLVVFKDRIEKVQVKYAQIVDGVVPIRSRTHSNTSVRQISRTYTSDDIDWLAVYCPDTDECYYIHSSALGQEAFQLRVKPTKNNQTKGVRWAKDYLSFSR